jgi:DNA-binding YbaB/EbfC family protein
MNLQKMMKQAQDMQNKMTDMQQRMERTEVEGQAAGGVVKVRINGRHELLAIAIDPSVINADDKETLEDLIIAAFRHAREQMDATYNDEMKKVTSGLNLPPGMKLPF